MKKRKKEIEEFVIKCVECKKEITGRTEKQCISNFNQHYKIHEN